MRLNLKKQPGKAVRQSPRMSYPPEREGSLVGRGEGRKGDEGLRCAEPAFSSTCISPDPPRCWLPCVFLASPLPGFLAAFG